MTNTMENKRVVSITIVILTLLSIPFIGMQLSDEIVWTVSDFVVAAVLLSALGLGIEVSLRMLRTLKQRAIAIGIMVFLFLMVWVELAVGVFGTPFAGS